MGDGSVQVLSLPGGVLSSTPAQVLALNRWQAGGAATAITIRVALSSRQASRLRSGFRWAAMLRGAGLARGLNGSRALPAVPPDADLRGSLRRRLARYPGA